MDWSWWGRWFWVACWSCYWSWCVWRCVWGSSRLRPGSIAAGAPTIRSAAVVLQQGRGEACCTPAFRCCWTVGADEPELRDGVGNSTTGGAARDAGVGVLQEVDVALVAQDVATSKTNNSIAVHVVPKTNGARAIVAVEGHGWLGRSDAAAAELLLLVFHPLALVCDALLGVRLPVQVQRDLDAVEPVNVPLLGAVEP